MAEYWLACDNCNTSWAECSRRAPAWCCRDCHHAEAHCAATIELEGRITLACERKLHSDGSHRAAAPYDVTTSKGVIERGTDVVWDS